MAAKERREDTAPRQAGRARLASARRERGLPRTGALGQTRPTSRPGIRSFSLALLALLTFLFLTTPRASADTQQIALATGWNLISLQIGTTTPGFTIAQVRAGLDRTNVLDSVWAYDPVQRTYTSYQSGTNYPSDLAALRPGVGYWVKVTSDAVLTLSGPVWNGALNLVAG